MASPNQITVSQLQRLVGTPDCPVLIDVCIDQDFALDPRIIPTSKRHAFQNIKELVPVLLGKRVVVVCQKGLKLSVGASAILRSEGVTAEYLEGGIFAWKAAGAPLVPEASIPFSRDTNRSVWVTRHRPKVDRIACPWLIRRFVDRNASFLFVEPSQVEAVAEKFGAAEFDTKSSFWGHRGGDCTFDTMLSEFQLHTLPLRRVAGIVRAADTNKLVEVNEAAGILAVLLGLSRMYKDDLKQLEAGMQLFDAVYRWSRDAVDEIHASQVV